MTMATACCWMMVNPASVRRSFPIRCCAGISVMQFYQPKRNCMQTFSSSVLITAPSAERLLYRTPTGKNTAYRAAKRCTAGRKTRAQESAKRTIRNPQMPGLQGLFNTGSGYIKESYQTPLFRRSNCPQTKKRKDVRLKHCDLSIIPKKDAQDQAPRSGPKSKIEGKT